MYNSITDEDDKDEVDGDEMRRWQWYGDDFQGYDQQSSRYPACVYVSAIYIHITLYTQ